MALELEVSVERQVAELRDGASVVWSAPVSTSRVGTGCESGSWRTPTGRFTVAEKIGDGAPLGARFVGRVWTGEVWQPGHQVEEDWVLTRILWLDGLEASNANTKERYIYIHGTNHEEEIGVPSSHGCIRLRNREMLELYERVPLGMVVRIE
ncbi:MAG: L,D-transpeptidase [Verrucomicrobiia bacterium]